MYDDARKELDKLMNDDEPSSTYREKKAKDDGGDFWCPIHGCSSSFATQEKLEDHVKKQTGKGHTRYRMENGIDFEQEVHVTRGEESTSPLSPPLAANQTDIRSFFKPVSKPNH